MKFQINSKTFFLTYPQCPLTKQEVLEHFQGKLSDIVDYIVASELHANGDPHVHVYLKLGSAYRSVDPKCFDINGYHGNYQGCRSTKNVIKYCTKAEDYLSNLDVESLLAGKSTRSTDMADLVNQKRTLVELVQEKPQYLFGYKKLKMDFQEFQNDLGSAYPPLPDKIPNPWGINLNSKISDKKRHYWIYSDKPNLGKTYHFARPLAQTYGAAHFAGEQIYWNLKGNENVVILDEYNAAIYKYFIINSMCDGTYSYRIFMGGVISLRDPLIIILSNKSISDIYPNMNELLYARFNEIKLD